ncbi:MAG: IPT/TIG domain-containing protein [Chitinophagales bacterium]|nr:IPT/TIG domain-containing protein [Chitinophagales bacterium]
MKNIPVYLFFICICAFSLGCDQCKNKCASVDAVLPDNNPSGYEVVLKVSGLSQSAKVVFGTVEASTRPGAKSDEIIATVPSGVSGNVEVSVEEGDCIARYDDFVVSGSLPSNVQPSLPNIIIPVPSSLPQSQTNITNFWVNAADPEGYKYGIRLIGDFNGGIVTTDDSFEFNSDDPKFNNNPVSGTVNNNINVISLAVNRTAKGGIIEHFEGSFIEVPSFLVAKAKFVIYLVSQETGRQLIIYYPN